MKNYYDVLEHAKKIIDKIESKYEQDDNILVVTHSIVKKVLINYFLGHSIDQLCDSPHIDGTSLTIVHLENGHATIEKVGCVEHMPPKTRFSH